MFSLYVLVFQLQIKPIIAAIAFNCLAFCCCCPSKASISFEDFFFYEPFPAMYVYNSKLLIWINQVHFWPHSLSVSDSY